MLYGLRDSPREFFNHLTERLERIGMKPRQHVIHVYFLVTK